jgi:hypothetical protein
MHEMQALSNETWMPCCETFAGNVFGAWWLQGVMHAEPSSSCGAHLTVPCAAGVLQPSLQAALVHKLDAAAAPAG